MADRNTVEEEEWEPEEVSESSVSQESVNHQENQTDDTTKGRTDVIDRAPRLIQRKASAVTKKLRQTPLISQSAEEESTEEEVNFDFCRICHDTDHDEQLISPCRCRGSLSLVHQSCLERWLAEADSTTCELCGYLYKTKRFPKYGMIPSVWAWLRSAETRRERRDLGLDLMALCAFTPIVIMGTYLGLIMADTLYTPDFEEPPGEDFRWFPEGRFNSYMSGEGFFSENDWRMLTSISTRIATLSVVSFMCTLDLAYASWFVFRLQHHISQWYIWYRRNCKVKLLSVSGDRRNVSSSEHEPSQT